MAHQPPPAGPGGSDPSGWPGAPDRAAGARPPSAPPPGWTGTTPGWAQPAGPPPAGPPPGPPRRAGPLGLSRRGMAIAGGLALLLVVAVAGIVLVSRGDGGGSGGDGGSSGGSGERVTAPAAAAGQELSLLDGRLVVVAPPGWEQNEAGTDTASIGVELRLPGRDLVATLVTTAQPPSPSLEGLLTAPDSTRFEVDTKGAGRLQCALLPATGTVRAGALRPNATIFVTLVVSALDGQPVEADVLQKLFVDQVASQLRIP